MYWYISSVQQISPIVAVTLHACLVERIFVLMKYQISQHNTRSLTHPWEVAVVKRSNPITRLHIIAMTFKVNCYYLFKSFCSFAICWIRLFHDWHPFSIAIACLQYAEKYCQKKTKTEVDIGIYCVRKWLYAFIMRLGNMQSCNRPSVIF